MSRNEWTTPAPSIATPTNSGSAGTDGANPAKSSAKLLAWSPGTSPLAVPSATPARRKASAPAANAGSTVGRTSASIEAAWPRLRT